MTKEQKAVYMKAWRLKNIEIVRDRERLYSKRFRKRNIESIRRSAKAYCEKNKEKIAVKSKEWKKALREEILNAYGGHCVCCGETRKPFLTLEHINHDGYLHRKTVNNVYLDIKRRGFPKNDYTLLCWNCNCATKGGLVCPHKEVLVNAN